MKCQECGCKIKGPIAYLNTKPYCPNPCYDRAKWRENHVSQEDLKMIAKRRWNKGI